ncbi:unnamed protein product [Adineta steineri]|uniref:K Homology domain-containing protein n=1 Tax=Adineta steineri TaxID=433720 RepID=A0A816AU74_9BILA|nr:unnamed protein product [Adineta steineri]CAF1602000.1 unnamed protein product [Adineta steineri]
MVSSSGFITEFNKETNYGYIQTQTNSQTTNERRLKFHVFNLKTNSKRYVTKEDLTFLGELFDFDIIQHTDGTEHEAINIRHRVLMCPIAGCSRLKAFISKNILDEHIHNKHCQEKKIVETKQQTKVIVKKPIPFTIKLMTSSAAVIGRFIGKNGVNLKEFQKTNHVQLKILTKTTAISLTQNPVVEIRVKPMKINVNTDDITQKLKSLWEKSVRKQQKEENKFKQILFNRIERRSIPVKQIDFNSDTRRARAFTLSGDELVRRRSTRYGQTEAILRKQQARSTLSLEGHRCAATGDLQRGGIKVVYIQSKKKISMKDKQWLVKEQLYDMSSDIDDE